MWNRVEPLEDIFYFCYSIISFKNDYSLRDSKYITTYHVLYFESGRKYFEPLENSFRSRQNQIDI